MAEEENKPAPSRVPGRPPKTSEKKEEKEETNSNVVTKRIVSEGEEFEVKVEVVNGNYVLTEDVLREVPLLNSNRTTHILVAAKGTQIAG